MSARIEDEGVKAARKSYLQECRVASSDSLKRFFKTETKRKSYHGRNSKREYQAKIMGNSK